MSEQPGYRVAYKTHIHDLDDDSLLQIFTHCRLEHGDDWNLQLKWRKLAQVCRRWRCFILESSFETILDMNLPLTYNSPPIVDLPPLPLAINYSETRTLTPKDEVNIQLGLQRHSLVRQVVLRAPSSSLNMLIEPMNKAFPKLEDLSLSSTTKEDIRSVLPETLQAPNLHRLSLHGVGLPKGLTLLSSTIALSTLSLTGIRASCYFPPRHLVTQLQGLPHLEELTIGFAIAIPLPGSEQELLLAPIPPVTLPTLKRLTFRGVDVYIDNLVAQINTPLLERLSLTLIFDLTFTLGNLGEFIHRTKGSGCLVAHVHFSNDGAYIDIGDKKPGLYNLWDHTKFGLQVNCGPEWQMDAATQVCRGLGMVVPTIEELGVQVNSKSDSLMDGAAGVFFRALGTVLRAIDKPTPDLTDDADPSDSQDTPNNNLLWHELLRTFPGVRKLHIGPSLTLELSKALASDSEELVLPGLQELVVSLKIDGAANALAAFFDTRESMGHPVLLLVPPDADEKEEKMKAEVLQNTISDRRSQRERDLDQHTFKEAIDKGIDDERREKEMWKARALALEELLMGLPVDISFYESNEDGPSIDTGYREKVGGLGLQYRSVASPSTSAGEGRAVDAFGTGRHPF